MLTLEFLRAPVWQGLTWTLLHFLWEGLAVAVVLLLLLGLVGVRRPRIRYLLCMGAMVVMVLCPIITFFVLVGDADWNVGQVDPVATSGITTAVDFGPDLPLEPVAHIPEPPSTVATLPLPVGQVGETRLWDRLGEYARGAQPYLLAAWVLGVVCLSARRPSC